MNAGALMTYALRTARRGDTLRTAALAMLDGDCGFLPVLDEKGRPIGVLTDRDICLLAARCDFRLSELRVEDAMTKDVVSCHPDDSIETVEQMMQRRRLRRLPVVSRSGELLGILSIGDIAREASRENHADLGAAVANEPVVETLARATHIRGRRVPPATARSKPVAPQQRT